MLVLSRKENETIVIDGNIRVTIIHCGRGKVKLGIQAPDHVSIMRAELEQRDERVTGFPNYDRAGASDLLAHSAAASGA